MIFGKGKCRRTIRTSNENLPKNAEIAAFWQGSYYSCLAYFVMIRTFCNLLYEKRKFFAKFPLFLFFFAQNTIKNYLFAFVAFAIDKFYRYML